VGWVEGVVLFLIICQTTFEGFGVGEVGGRGFWLDSWGSNPLADPLAQRVLPFEVMGWGFRV